MSDRLALEWTSPKNTLDRIKVGSACYTANNVRFDRGKLQADSDFIEVIPAPAAGGACWGGIFARFEGVEEYLAVIGTKVYRADVGDTVWTELTSTPTVTGSEWQFQQYGGKVYAVNETDGIRIHTIGGNDWDGGQVPPVTQDDPLYTFQNKWKDPVNGAFNSIYTLLNGATSAFVVNGVAPGTPPTKVIAGNSYIQYQFNAIYGLGLYDWELTISFAANQDLEFADAWYVEVEFPTGVMTPNTLDYELVGSSVTSNMEAGTQTPQASSPRASRVFYCLADRTNRDSTPGIVSLRLRWQHWISWAIQATDTFRVRIHRGDTWQNNPSGFLVNDGPVTASREYAYSGYDVSASIEGPLSQIKRSSVSPNSLLGDYTVLRPLYPVGSPLGVTDMLRIYRKRVSDGKFFKVAETLNAATPADVEDHYIEGELGDLDEYEESTTLPFVLKPHAVGVHGASLVVAVAYDAYISKPNRPLEFEELNSAPDPSDPEQGRSVYVDPLRAYKVLAIVGGSGLYFGTLSRVFAMYGDLPPNMTAPKVVDNVGPVGPHCMALYENGVIVLNAEGCHYLRPLVDSAEDVGNRGAVNLMSELRESVKSAGFSADSVLVVHRGDVYVTSADKYMVRDARSGQWRTGARGGLGGALVIQQMFADPEYDLHALGSTGKLLRLDSTGATVASSWEYVTGDIVRVKRARIKSIQVVATGAPTVKVQCWDGKEAEIPAAGGKTYTVDPAAFQLRGFQAGQHYGTQFRLTIAGDGAATVSGLIIEFEDLGGGGNR